MSDTPHIVILGVGNLLYTDEGFGIHVVQRLKELYEFPDNVSIVDGGVLGLSLLGVISDADQLIIIDAIKNNGKPGSLYRLDRETIPERIRAKNSLHQVDLLETLTVYQQTGKAPETIIIGVEPEDIDTMSLNLSATTEAKVNPVMDMVLLEVQQLGAHYQKKKSS